MKKGNFTQSVTNFKNKSTSAVPVIVDVKLVNSLIGNEEDKAPSVAAVNAGLEGKITEEQAKKIAEDAVKNIDFPKQVQADWSQNSIASADYIKNKPNIKQGSGNYSIEENGSSATSDFAHAEGNDTQATGVASHSEGNGTQASGASSHAEGYKSRVTEAGKYSHAEGYNTEVSGQGAHAEGKDSIVKGFYAHAEGMGSKAYGHRSHAEGNGTTAGIDGQADNTDGAHAEGISTTASGKAAHAEGKKTTASGEGAHAEGTGTTASALGAHAEGSSTQASGSQSHAEGQATTASHWTAHAEGYGAKAIANKAHAEGDSTTASGESSHAEGRGTIANGNIQHVQGRYNVPDNNMAHIVGNGTSDTDRKNIHTLDWDGNAWFSGNIKIGGSKYGYGKEVATKNYVDDLAAIKVDDWDGATGGYITLRTRIKKTTGTETVLVKAHNQPLANSISTWNNEKQLSTEDPTGEKHCANKKYVDSMHLSLSIDPSTFVLNASLLNANNEVISIQQIDLPLEEMIVSGKVSDDGEKIILTLKNGENIEFGVSALVDGFATKEDLKNIEIQEQKQADWSQENTDAVDYIKNKPVAGEIFKTSIKDGILVLEQSDAICQKGDSAYDVAVKNGFEGTEKEWLESLKGEGVDDETLEKITALEEGKLDKITDVSQAGNFGGAYILKTDGTQGMMKITNTTGGGTLPMRGNGGHIVVGLDPTNQYMATSKKYVDDLAATKLDLPQDTTLNAQYMPTWVRRKNEETGEYYIQQISKRVVDGLSSVAAFNAVSYLPNTASYGSTFKDGGAVLLTGEPKQPCHAATKNYVDNAIGDVKSKLDAFGIFYDFVKECSGTPHFEIPAGAMATAYIESADFYAHNTDGTLVYTGTANGLYFLDENQMDISFTSFTAPAYIQIPENAREIRVNCEELIPGDVGWDAGPIVFTGYIYFQVKRGG